MEQQNSYLVGSYLDDVIPTEKNILSLWIKKRLHNYTYIYMPSKTTGHNHTTPTNKSRSHNHRFKPNINMHTSP